MIKGFKIRKRKKTSIVNYIIIEEFKGKRKIEDILADLILFDLNAKAA